MLLRSLPQLAAILFSSFSLVYADPRNGQPDSEGVDKIDGVPVSSLQNGKAKLSAQAIQDRTGWTVTADSWQGGNEPQNVLDGNANTFWHTQWNPNNAAMPHQITIDMKSSRYVNGMTYQPRQDGNWNGNWGQHKIYLSNDGNNFGAPVAIGTFKNDQQTKNVVFASTNARYMKVVILTEGNGNPWASCAEINILSAPGPPPNPSGVGSWGPTINTPLVAVAVALLHDTMKVMMWSSYLASTFTGGNGGLTVTASYDSAAQIVTQRIVTNTNHDMFCPGLSLDFGGKVFVTGGNDNARASFYDPPFDQWYSYPNMLIGRGYQSQTTISDGRTFVIGGSWSGGQGGKNGELYSPNANTWYPLPGCPVGPMLTADNDGVFRADNHGWLFAWKDKTVFQAGPSKQMNWYGTAAKMGIPRLRRHLEPFAESIVLGCTTRNCKEHSTQPEIIIDGPSLAYHIYYRVFAHKPAYLGPIDAIPSYTELGKAFLIFLDELVRYGIKVKHIFFDGGLPTNKTEIRKSRLEANLKQLILSHRTSPNGFNVSRASAQPPPVSASQVFDSTRCSQLSTKVLPVSPFLIPAILDSLSGSLYAAVTNVVLGEADIFCARAVSEWGGIILTNDSDLLVYNLGTQGGVVFLDQLEFREAHGTSRKCDTFQAFVNKTSDISSRLGFDDFRSIAFEIALDTHVSFPVAIKRAGLREDDTSDRKSLQSFFDEYDTKPFSLENYQRTDMALATGRFNGLFLDARNSELIISGSMYLPFLIDDPSKTSAWNVSRQLRLFAYSCLALGIYQFPKTIFEHSRRGARIVENRVQTLSCEDTIAFGKMLIDSVESFEDSVSGLCKQHIWRLFAAHSVYKWYLDEEKSLPSESSLVAAYAGITAGDKLTWFDIHISAQMQAFLYAFRALKQILNYLNVKADGRSLLPAELWAVQMRLSSLPSINELIPSRLELATQSMPTSALLALLLSPMQEDIQLSDDVSSLETGGIDNKENELVGAIGVRQSGNPLKTCHSEKEGKEKEKRREGSKFHYSTKKRQCADKTRNAQYSTIRTTAPHSNLYDLLPPSG